MLVFKPENYGIIGFLETTKALAGVPFMAQQLTNLNRVHEDVGSSPGHAQWGKDPAVTVKCGVGCRRG